MTNHMFKVALLLIAIICTGNKLAKADTKILNNLRLIVENSSRDETTSLENDKDLKVQGMLVDYLFTPNDSEHIVKSIIEYVADKNGYRAKYKQQLEDFSLTPRLAISTLKTFGG